MFEVILNWFILPLIVLAIGWSMKKNPPKTISRVNGYRTKRSMKNQATWEFANSYFANLLYKVGLAELLISLALVWFFLYSFEVTFIVLALQSLSFVTVMIITEIALRKRFDKNGMKININGKVKK